MERSSDPLMYASHYLGHFFTCNVLTLALLNYRASTRTGYTVSTSIVVPNIPIALQLFNLFPASISHALTHIPARFVLLETEEIAGDCWLNL